MKKILLLLTCLLCTAVMMADEKPETPQAVKTEKAKFKNFKTIGTTNGVTYVKWDTRDGRVWQCEISSINPHKNWEIPINDKPLADNNIPGRFSIQIGYDNRPFTIFFLLDKVTGDTWQIITAINDKDRKFEKLGPKK